MDYNTLIDNVISNVNWTYVKYVHDRLEITWEPDRDDENSCAHSPSIYELQEELRIIVKFALIKDIPIVECGNWVVIWRNEKTSLTEHDNEIRLEAYFSVEHASASEMIENKDALEKLLQEMLLLEEYEKAAIIRDKLNNIKNE